MKLRELSQEEKDRLNARRLCRAFIKNLELIKTLPLEELHEHTLVLLYNTTVNYPGFIIAFNAKIKAILKQRNQNQLEGRTKNETS